MRETAAGKLFTWSKNRQVYCRLLRWPVPYCFLFIVTLSIEATKFGVSEEGRGNESLVCCGMLLNTSQSGLTNLSCICDGVNGSQCRGGVSISPNLKSDYRLHFCTSFPLYEVLNAEDLQNRTFCHEQLKKLQEADKNANNSYTLFEGIIGRLDCGNEGMDHTYSVTSTCQDCLAAYKNWICFTEVSAAILNPSGSAQPRRRRPCLSLCQTVLRRCPYFPPVPNFRDSLVQVGYSAFNCLDHKVWTQDYGNSGNCLDVDEVQENREQDYGLSTVKPTETTEALPTKNSTTSNSTDGSNR